MNTGDIITIKAHKADGVCYQWWDATVIKIAECYVVLTMPKGTPYYDVKKGARHARYDCRLSYHFDKLHTFIEAFNDDGALAKLYLDICNPPRIVNDEVHYTDYELDVERTMPDAAVIVDEDEFAEAVVTYGYTPEFQAQCYAAAHEALAVANAMPSIA